MMVGDAEEVVSMLADDVLNTETVDDQYKLDGTPYVSPEARCGNSFVVP